MREFKKFPENGFYLVVEPFKSENQGFLVGEVVGLIRWGSSEYMRITKTGECFGGWANYMEVEDLPKLMKLSPTEVTQITGDHELDEASLSIEEFGKACKLVQNLLPVSQCEHCGKVVGLAVHQDFVTLVASWDNGKKEFTILGSSKFEFLDKDSGELTPQSMLVCSLNCGTKVCPPSCYIVTVDTAEPGLAAHLAWNSIGQELPKF